MSLTNFPNGIFATPNLGAVDFAGWFGTYVWYVDGDLGIDNNEGSMDAPFKTIQKAINMSSAQDTIFIKQMAPSSTDASEPGTYVENLSIPYTKHGLKLIGVTSSGTKMPFGGPKIKNASAGILLDVLAPNVHLENLQFNCTRNSGTHGIYFESDTTSYTTMGGAVGFTMKNCMIKNGGQTGVYGGVTIVGGYGGVITNCTFDGCLYGILLGNSIVPSNGHTVEFSNFKDINLAVATAHITVAAGLNADVNIDHCNFDAATKFIVLGDGGGGVISFCTCNDGSTTTAANSGGKIEIPAACDEWSVVGCYGGGNALIAQNGS